MASNSPTVTFFGYWSGQLPAIAELHFRSFLHHHPGSRYELWLDEDDASTIDAPQLQWIKTHPRIAVRPFSLNALIEKHVTKAPVARFEGFPRARRLGVSVHRRIGPLIAPGKSWQHELFGLTYMHSSRLFHGFGGDKTYRGDLARLLVPLEHYRQKCLYSDLDVCFMSDLTALCEGAGFVYRWSTYDFANNAIVYLPDETWSAALVRRANAIETYRPWILLSNATCAELGIAIQPPKLFDPLWTPGSVLHGDPAKFFEARDNLALDLHALSTERFLAIHWHNNWKTVPAANSIYSGLLRACEGAIE